MKEHSSVNIPKNVIIFDEMLAPLKLITRKPILPTKEELTDNSRSRSAKLRIAEKNKD